MMDFIKEYIKQAGKKRFVVYAVIMGVLALNVLGALVMITAGRIEPVKGENAYQQLSAEVHTGSDSVDFELLREQNEDICAWLISEGTGIDYPVVQGEDNKYYRRHLFSGEANRMGCLYMDADCAAGLTDKNTVIYGRAQLNSIYRYTEQSYYDLLPSMTLCTPDEKYTILLYAGVLTEKAEEAVKNDFADEAEFMDYAAWLRKNSVFQSNITVEKSDQLITFCASGGKKDFVLVGVIA